MIPNNSPIVQSQYQFDGISRPIADPRVAAFQLLLDATDAGVYDEARRALRQLRSLGISVVLLPKATGGAK